MFFVIVILHIRANSNGLGCSGVSCLFSPLKREHNSVLRLLCNMDQASLTALETLLIELKLFPDTPCVTESVLFPFELELLLGKTCETSHEHSPSESAKF